MVVKHETTVVRQKQIISAARKLIVENGSEHVTVRRIAKEIGVSEGALYRHFTSKRDVLSFLVDDIQESLVSDINKHYSGEIGILDSLELIMREHISAIEQRRGTAFLVIAEIVSLGDNKLNQKIYGVINQYITRIKDMLSEGVRGGALRQDLDLDAAAILFFGMIHGLVNLWALSHYSFDLEVKFTPIWKTFRESVVRH